MPRKKGRKTDPKNWKNHGKLQHFNVSPRAKTINKILFAI
jgi:hypothetical protein